MALTDAVIVLVALALPIWLLVEQVVWWASSKESQAELDHGTGTRSHVGHRSRGARLARRRTVARPPAVSQGAPSADGLGDMREVGVAPGRAPLGASAKGRLSKSP